MIYRVFLVVLLLINFSRSFTQSWISSNFINGEGTVYQIGSSIDVDGGIYIYGYYDNNIITEDDQYVTKGSRDLFLSKFNSDLELIWIKSFGSTGMEYVGGGSIISPENIIYVTGGFRNTIFFTEDDSLVSLGVFDTFLAAFTTNGDFLWAKRIAEGTGNQRPTQIAIDQNQNLLIAGFFDGATTIGSKLLNDNDAFNDIFLTTFDKNGNYISAKQIIVKNTGRIFGINTKANTYYFTGIYSDSLCMDIDTIASLNTTYDAFIYATNTNLEGQWVRTVSGYGDEYLYSVSTFSNSNPLISGYSNSTQILIDSTVNEMASPLFSKGGYDIFLCQYDIDGNLLKKGNYGGLSDEQTYFSNVIDDEIHVTGFTTGTSIWGSDTIKTNGTTDKALLYAKINSEFEVSQARMLNSTIPNKSERGSSVMKIDNRLYVIGSTLSDSLVIRDSVYHNLGIGFEKTYIVEIGCLPITLNSSTPTDLACNGIPTGAISLDASGGFTGLMYSIDGGQTYMSSSDFADLAAGDYNIMVMDSAKCFVDGGLISLTQPEEFTIQNTSHTDVTTYLGSDGTISVSTAGGTSPYVFTLNGNSPQAIGDFANLVVGEYLVNIIDANNCGPLETMPIVITGPNSINEFEAGNLKVYPNPVASELNIELTGVKEHNIKLTLFDATGRILMSKESPVVNGSLTEKIDVSEFQQGMMFLKIGGEKKMIPVMKVGE